jgi:hypothetical protein
MEYTDKAVTIAFLLIITHSSLFIIFKLFNFSTP